MDERVTDLVGLNTAPGCGATSNDQLLPLHYKERDSKWFQSFWVKPSPGKGYFEIPAKGFGKECWRAVSMADGLQREQDIQIKHSRGTTSANKRKEIKVIRIVAINVAIKEKIGIFIENISSNLKGLANYKHLCSAEMMNREVFYKMESKSGSGNTRWSPRNLSQKEVCACEPLLEQTELIQHKCPVQTALAQNARITEGEKSPKITEPNLPHPVHRPHTILQSHLCWTHMYLSFPAFLSHC